MQGLFEHRGMALIHCLSGLMKLVAVNLDAESDARRTQEQETLEQLVVISAGLNSLVAQECFENTTVVDVLKNGHIHPRMMSVRTHTYQSSNSPAASRGKNGCAGR